MVAPEVEYLKNQISNHITLFFDLNGKEIFDSNKIQFLTYEDSANSTEKIIAVPFDINTPKNKIESFTVPFNNTVLTLWNRIDKPSNSSWKAIPNESTPLWYQNDYGTLIPAWNLFGNLFDLLTFAEEKDSNLKDSHGRFSAAFSPRAADGLLEVPVFNEAVAALVAAYISLKESVQPVLDLNGIVKPPVIILSHDCDLLRGNDFWTQAVRGIRTVLPLKKFKPPALQNIWWIIKNQISPRQYFYDNVTGMIDIERCFGYSSTFYFINGSGGRFGARSGFEILKEIKNKIPDQWDTGLHYNYDTFLNDQKFKEQHDQLNSIHDQKVTNGRAHYIKFDPENSFHFLLRHGIDLDESSGYADMVGYRNGIAGCFQVYDREQKKPIDIWELPMMIMDATFVSQYGNRVIEYYSRMLTHLNHIGGSLSINFHPGQFFNPEHKHMLGVYNKILIESRNIGAKSMTARALVAQIR